MDFILIYCFFLFLVLSFYSVGNFTLRIIFKNKLSVYTRNVIFGYVILTIFFYFFYFFLKIKNVYIITIVLLFISYCFYHSIEDIKKNLENIILFLFLKSLLIFIFFIPAYLYGEQFYVFRGNYWDAFNYLSSALLFNLTEYRDILDKNIFINFENFQSIKEIITYRPIINYFLSIFLYLKTVDIFLLYYFFKIFLALLIFTSIFDFLDILEKKYFFKKATISIIFCLCFFNLYVFEIDALSHLGSLSILIYALKNLKPFLNTLKQQKAIKDIIFYILILTSLFIVYPEVFIFYSLILLSFTLIIFITKPKIYFYKNIFVCFIIFLIFTSVSYETNYIFLLNQINQSLNSNNWWGYFGSFIFGRENLVVDPVFVENIVNLIKINTSFEVFLFIIVKHLESGYYFFTLNIIPSLFGFYYLTVGKLENIFSILLLFFSIFLNFYIIHKLYITSRYFFLKKNYEIIISTINIILLMIFFITIGNFWVVIKIYTYTLFFLYLFLIIDFESKKIDYFILACLLIFPIYKYSNFNYGIGREDSFPSIINDKNKKQINWNITEQDFLKCNNIYINIDDYFMKSYIQMKLIYYTKDIIYTKNNFTNLCEVSVKNKNFNVKVIND